MIVKKFVDAFTLNEYKIEAFGIVYEFKIEDYDCSGNMAKCLIIDHTNNERYHSDGYLELNGHVIMTRWDKTYDYNRDNWVTDKNLIVEII